MRRPLTRLARSFVPLLKATAAGWVRDNAMRLSAALALYTILSLPPLLVITAKVIGVVIRDKDYVRSQLTAQIDALMGPQVALAAQPMLVAGSQPGGGTLATVFSTAVLVFSATGVFVELQDAMNTIWGVKPKPNQGVRDFVRTRLLSLAMVFGTGFLLLVSMCLTTAAVRLAAYVAGDQAWVALVLDPAVSLAVVTVLFAGTFKFLPDVKLAWRHVWGGGLLTAVLFTAGKYALAAYFGYAAPTSAFGAAGSLAAVMLWVYYSSFILFFGAEFTKVWSLRHLHDAVVPEANAVKVTEEDRARQGIPTERRLAEAAAGEPLADGPAAPQAGGGAASGAGGGTGAA
jgi:membrane protein